jgi:hypothetical protein
MYASHFGQRKGFTEHKEMCFIVHVCVENARLKSFFFPLHASLFNGID